MKICFVVNNERQKAIVQKIKENEINNIIKSVKYGKEVINEIRQEQVDILVTFDLCGFELSTLTDNIAYNLLDCKQVHVLTNQNLQNEEYLLKQLSMSMFFCVVGTNYYSHLKKNYPNIPFLYQIEGWSKGVTDREADSNASVLVKVINQLLKEFDVERK